MCFTTSFTPLTRRISMKSICGLRFGNVTKIFGKFLFVNAANARDQIEYITKSIWGNCYVIASRNPYVKF